MNNFLLAEQTFAHQVFCQQRKHFGVAMPFEVLEFGQYVVDLG